MDVNESKVFAGYIPVIHQGYIEAFNRHPDIPIGIMDHTLTELVPYLRKDIRALPSSVIQECLTGMGRESFILSHADFEQNPHRQYIMPDDDLTDAIEAGYPDVRIEREPVFLRWDRNATIVNQDITPTEKSPSTPRTRSQSASSPRNVPARTGGDTLAPWQ